MNEKRVDEIFEFIFNNSIQLDPDPIRRGPKYLNTQVAECRNMSSRVQEFAREVEFEKLQLTRSLNRLETEYQLNFNELLVNDTAVLRKTSAKDREAAANNILKDALREIADVKAALSDLGHVATIIKSKLDELKDVNRDIKTQMGLISDEIKLGNFWGDQSDSGQHKIRAQDIDVSDLDPNYDENKMQKNDESEDYISDLTPSNDVDAESALDLIEIPSKENPVSMPNTDIDLDGLFD